MPFHILLHTNASEVGEMCVLIKSLMRRKTTAGIIRNAVHRDGVRTDQLMFEERF